MNVKTRNRYLLSFKLQFKSVNGLFSDDTEIYLPRASQRSVEFRSLNPLNYLLLYAILHARITVIKSCKCKVKGVLKF